jgi:hypothetical protein
MKMFKKKEIKGLVCLLAIMLASKGWAVAEEATQGTETKAIGTQTIEPKLIMECKFDEPVVDVIFGEATMTVKEARALGMKGLEKKKAMEIVKVQYPKVVVANNKDEKEVRDTGLMTSIKFLDKYKKANKEFVVSQHLTKKPGWIHPMGEPDSVLFNISKNRKYICVNIPFPITEEDYYGYGEDWYKFVLRESEAVILNTEGDIIRKIKASYDTLVSPNGKYVVDIDISGEGAGPLVIYNENGIVKKIFLLDCWGIDFSKDGNWFAVIGETGEGVDYLIILDKNGDEFWRKKITETDWYIEEMNISDDDIITVTTWNVRTGQKLKYRFDKEGNLIERKSKKEE